MKIYISCVHSGPNPVAGLGIARSLRLAFPAAYLIGVDYSTRSSGLHSSYFDEVHVQQPWNDLDLALYANHIRDLLDEGAYWISSLDLETRWLREAVGEHPNLIAPPLHALQQVTKPEMPASEKLPLRLPPTISGIAPDWEVHEFCRRHGWRVYVKGPNYEAYRIYDWQDLLRAREILAQRWATDAIFIQAHIAGQEESITYAANNGQLLHAVHLIKRDITVEGKTWAARIEAVPEQFLDPLRQVITELNWTGGGELECIRSNDGIFWLIDWNPRFPAWIHGATLTGHNLPGLLFQSITKATMRYAPIRSDEFTRIVLEIPTRSDLPLPPLQPGIELLESNPKTPAGMPRLAQRIGMQATESRSAAPAVPDYLLQDLQALDTLTMETPAVIRLPNSLHTHLLHFAQSADEASTPDVTVQVAYSIKTDPEPRLLQAAQECGFLAEAISQQEVNHALENGFSVGDIVLNGPGKWWPERRYPVEAFKHVFADSLEELGDYRSSPPRQIGIRLRLPTVRSRFGVVLEPFAQFQRLIETLAGFTEKRDVALHFHFASESIGVSRWWGMYEALLGWGTAVEYITGRHVTTLDIGGGWFPDDARRDLLPNLRRAVQQAHKQLPHLREFLLEPGKALSQPSAALLVRVLEMRQLGDGGREIVVDGAISDLPMSHLYPHRVLAFGRDGEWRALAGGKDRILGRLCMETDILAQQIELPPQTAAGDVLAICDAGAYDRSMAYDFAKG